MKIIVDTNVILDFLLLRESHMADAKELFKKISQEEVEAFTTASSVTDIYYIIAKRLGGDTARGAVRHLLTILGVIAVDGDDCIGALDFPIADFEDALVSVCANREGVNHIVSNDKEFLKVGTNLTSVISTRSFLELSEGRHQ